MIMTVYSLSSCGSLPEELYAEERPVYLPEDRTEGEKLPEQFRAEPRLREIPGSPGEKIPLFRRILWWILFRLGLGAGKESFSRAGKRARSMAEELTGRDEACVVAASPAFLELFLRAMRRKGFVVRRSMVGFVRPGEKIFLSQRKDHCGGCSHNCLLKNPGCGVGRDKARRGY